MPNTESAAGVNIYLFWGVLLVSCLALGGLVYYAVIQNNQIKTLQTSQSELTFELASTTKQLTAELTTASNTIASLTQERDDLSERLIIEKAKNDEFADQIDDLSGAIGQLDKLSKTDKELLQKYSKVYFLSEHFVPSKLKLIDSDYLATGKKDLYFHADALPFLNRMLAAAKKDGIDITVVSAYRSFEKQSELKGAYTQTYGSGANTFSADQGYSEHQLGTTVDLSTPTLGTNLVTSFETTTAFAWLQKNAYKYGFVLSYPKGNTYYVYEPWHWRFVGEDLARDLHRDQASFYAWDQRKIDEYLIKIFD